MKTFREYCDDRNSKNEGLWLNDSLAKFGHSRLDPLGLRKRKASKPFVPTPPKVVDKKTAVTLPVPVCKSGTCNNSTASPSPRKNVVRDVRQSLGIVENVSTQS